MKLFKKNGYIQRSLKVLGDIFLFVGFTHHSSEYVFGLKVGPEMGTKHYCSREVSFHFFTYRVGFWLEDTV